MAFLQQFQWWRARCKKHPPDEIHRAGELSELRLEKLSRAAGKANGWHVFASVRIPDPDDGGRREIDLVIVGGNTLLVVEQKHWAGRFEINEDGEFVQFRNNGSEHNHSTVAERIARKARMLNEIHHRRIKQKQSDSVEVRVIVAMTHQKLEWPKIPKNFQQEMVDEAGFIKILEETVPGKLNEDLLQTVEGFSTWDEIELHGGLTLKGDLIHLGLGSEIDDWFKLRGGDLNVQTTHHRSIFSIFNKTPSRVKLSHGSKNIEATLAKDLQLKMHVVGEKERRFVDWGNVNKVFASRPPAEWGEKPNSKWDKV
ncbi:MAG: nuclease-related domain-containing protein [Candidatus Poseidoniaceae archaeon]